MAEDRAPSTPKPRETLVDVRQSQAEGVEQALLALHACQSVAELTATLEKETANILQAERATFYRLEGQEKLPTLTAIREKGKARVSFPLGEGIAGNVAKDVGYYICNDPAKDSMFQEPIDGAPGVRVRNVASVAMEAGGEVVGVLQALNRTGRNFNEDDAYWLQRLADHGAVAFARLKKSEDGWTFARDLAEAVAQAVDDKHATTVGHSDRVRQIALALGREFKFSPEELLELELAALLHDVGRLALSPEAFEGTQGPGYASADERLHLVLSEAFLRGLRLPKGMHRLGEIALAHHERADGKGFPRGRTSGEVPLSARILQVANAFDQLAGGRTPATQGKRLSDDELAKLLQAQAGAELDGDVVKRLVERKLYKIEKRRFPRYDYEAPLDVSLLGASGQAADGGEIQTQALELSEGGILFRSEKKLPALALLKLRIHLPTEKIEALARVARQLPDADKKGFKIGAYFLWYGTP